MLVKIFVVFLPWVVKRRVLSWWFKYEIHPLAHIGFAWVFPKMLIMAQGAKIDHLTVAVNLDSIRIGKDSTIGRTNWITGFPSGTDSLHFKHQEGRESELLIGNSSAITKNHHIDCTSRIEIGSFTTIAGYQTQMLTHSVDLVESRQDSSPIHIGDYAFVGTNCVVLGGSVLPSHSVLGAKSLLNKKFTEEWKVYGGSPARIVGEISRDAKYFSRKEGFVY
jgi:acetyltransferase-like isoleucine patch superfamily enzyme